jgi:hypothetical protein
VASQFLIFPHLWEKVKVPWCKIGAVPQCHELLLHDALKKCDASSDSEGGTATENQNYDFLWMSHPSDD